VFAGAGNLGHVLENRACMTIGPVLPANRPVVIVSSPEWAAAGFCFMEGEMRNLMLAGLLAAALFGVATPASAVSDADLNQAIALCRTTVAQQAGADLDHARFHQVSERGRLVRVDIQLWKNGRLTNVRCEVTTGQTPLSIAQITPALQTANAQ